MKYDVYGIGNILVDLAIQVSDSLIKEINLEKGRFHLVDSKEIMKKIGHKEIKITPAGSAANTIHGIACLGGSCILTGKVGNDEHAEFYEKNSCFTCNFPRSETKPTGRNINLITPDAQRTFAVDLGAALDLKNSDINESALKNSKILHLTGYAIECTKEPCLHALNIAKNNNVKISIDLSDPGVIERNLDELKEIVKKYADIIFFNEEEAKMFTGMDADEAVSKLGEYADIAIVKIGAKGSLINDQGAIIMIEGIKANAIDTTGAGDLYAAGILYGIIKDYDLEMAGNLASKIAAKIVEQIGPRPEFDLKSFIE